MKWFERMTGIPEEPGRIHQQFTMQGETLHCLQNGRSWEAGRLEIPTLEKLRNQVGQAPASGPSLTLSETVGDAGHLHTLPENKGATFQVASQFNLLEMVSPSVTPEMGITRYEMDRTQGPACAIACGAGTIYRNYFVPLGDQLGQTEEKQVNCLDKIEDHFRQETGDVLWNMQNGYLLTTRNNLLKIEKRINSTDRRDHGSLKGMLRVGVQWGTEVTMDDTGHQVTQVYCSALPVSYSSMARHDWEVFARMILEATYEATFAIGWLNYLQTGNNRLFLTQVGGGAFGNSRNWIFDAIRKAVKKFRKYPLDVRIVSYGRTDPYVQEFIESR